MSAFSPPIAVGASHAAPSAQQAPAPGQAQDMDALLSPGDARLLRDLRACLDEVDTAHAPQPERSDYDLNDAITRPRKALNPAAVMAVVTPREAGLMVVFTRRADHLSRHAGQVAFPGGRVDATDASAADAALREAHEEIGLAPHTVELLGGFDAYETVTGYAIAPFVGLAPGDFVAHPEPNEVADVFEAPLPFILDPANLRCETQFWRGADRRYYVLEYGGHRIWGATAGMIHALQTRMGAA